MYMSYTCVHVAEQFVLYCLLHNDSYVGVSMCMKLKIALHPFHFSSFKHFLFSSPQNPSLGSHLRVFLILLKYDISFNTFAMQTFYSKRCLNKVECVWTLCMEIIPTRQSFSHACDWFCVISRPSQQVLVLRVVWLWVSVVQMLQTQTRE